MLIDIYLHLYFTFTFTFTFTIVVVNYSSKMLSRAGFKIFEGIIVKFEEYTKAEINIWSSSGSLQIIFKNFNCEDEQEFGK